MTKKICFKMLELVVGMDSKNMDEVNCFVLQINRKLSHTQLVTWTWRNLSSRNTHARYIAHAHTQ